MSNHANDDLDAVTLAQYRAAIERAAAADPAARSATAAVFAALDRRDARDREMLEIVREVAYSIPNPDKDTLDFARAGQWALALNRNADELVARARALLAK